MVEFTSTHIVLPHSGCKACWEMMSSHDLRRKERYKVLMRLESGGPQLHVLAPKSSRWQCLLMRFSRD